MYSPFLSFYIYTHLHLTRILSQQNFEQSIYMDCVSSN